MKELKNTIIGLLCNKSFLKDYICTIAVRSARRTVLRMYAKKPTAVGYISPATDDCEQIRMFLDKYLKLDAAESVKTTANTFMGDVPYANIEVDQDLQKAFFEAGAYLKKLCKDWKKTNSPRYSQIRSEYFRNYAEETESPSDLMEQSLAKPKVTLEDFEEYTDEGERMGLSTANTPRQVWDAVIVNSEYRISGVNCNTATIVSKPKEEFTMIKVEKQTLLNGTKIETFSDEAIYSMIAAAEKKVEELETIKNKPKRLVKEIESRRADIQTLVDYLDSKES